MFLFFFGFIFTFFVLPEDEDEFLGLYEINVEDEEAYDEFLGF
jgi:hypothetical protein